jgi:hypothetical protein
MEAAVLAGEAVHSVGPRFGISRDCLRKHKDRGHISTGVAKAAEVREVAHADNVLAEVSRLKFEANSLLETAKSGGDIRAAVMALRECVRIAELLSKIAGLIEERNLTLNVMTVTPEAARDLARLFLQRQERRELPAGEPDSAAPEVIDAVLVGSE